MIDEKKIISLFKKLNEALKFQHQKGEIGIVGGAVMCLVYKARPATRDVDAIFEPSTIIRNLAQQLALDEGLAPDWLNDSVKAYIQPHIAKQEVLTLSHLNVWAPEAEYMLAMKCLSSRIDTQDGDDIRFLVKYLGLTKPKEVFNLIEKYYPKNRIEAKTQFFIEELMESLPNSTP